MLLYILQTVMFYSIQVPTASACHDNIFTLCNLFFFFPLFILKPCAVGRLDTFVPVNDNEVSFPG